MFMNAALQIILTKQRLFLLISIQFFYVVMANATIMILPIQGDVIGEVQHVSSEVNDTIDKIGRRYDVGYYEIIRANPQIDTRDSLLANSRLIIPGQYILP